MTEGDARRLLHPFHVDLGPGQISQVLTYLELLMRWNRSINLTAIRTEEEIVTRHFGESFCLARYVQLSGRLLDVGSGAGFPGLALKIVFPELSLTLLEPVGKKRAFLKEAARACEMRTVEVVSARLEDFRGLGSQDYSPFDIVTMRALGGLGGLVLRTSRVLPAGGRIYLWVSHKQGELLAHLAKLRPLFDWADPIAIPLAKSREIWRGVRTIYDGALA